MKNKIALKITLIYFSIGFLWILFSDQFILSMGTSGSYVTALQTYKGWLFVGITATLLFFLIRKEILKKNIVEKDLIKARMKAEESDLLKSAFLSNLSHEIRTPLNGILGFCELMLDDSFSNEDKQIFARNLNKNGNDLLKLINDIMDISKIQENQYEISKRMFNLNNLLEQIYLEYLKSDLKITQKQLSFKLITDNKDTEIELFSDPVRLTHICRNLLNNSLFFTNKGFVHFGYTTKETGIELFVEDSGCGIDESNKDQIFKPFFKGRNLVIGSRGFGLGLAISKGLVKLLGSDLCFNSTPGVGSKFYFTIDKKDVFLQNTNSGEQTNIGLKMKTIDITHLDKNLTNN